MKTVQTTAGPVKCRLYDLYGRRATTLREMSNHYAVVAKGASVTVEEHGCSGYVTIVLDECPSCRVSVRMTRVEIADLLFEPFEHDPKRRRR